MPPEKKVLVLHDRGPAVSLERVQAVVDRLRSSGIDLAMEPDLGIGEADLVLFIWTGGGDLPKLPSRGSFHWKSTVATFQDVPPETVPEPLRDLPRFPADTESGFEELVLHLLVELETRWLISQYESPGDTPPVVAPESRPKDGGDEDLEAIVKGLDEGGWRRHEPVSYQVSPSPPPGSAPPPAGPEDPPRTAYARLDAPDIAVAEEEIEAVVGLAEKPSPGVSGGPMTRPETSVGSYILTVQLVAEGFRLRDGEKWRRELLVTADDPWPAAVFHLTPEPQEQEVRPRFLQAFYTVSGQTMGMAFRPMVLQRSAEEPAEASDRLDEPGVDLTIPTDMAAPDLEVRILLDPEHEGRLVWTFTSRHRELELPDEALRTSIGSDPKGFARQLVDKVNAREGMPGIYDLLAGIGVSIAEAMPEELWNLLREVAAQVEGPPDVLILSAEPYIPWELARMEEPLIDPAAPLFLAAQANVGRWVLPQRERATGSRQRPQQPPPTEVGVSSVAVVTGVYDRPGWSRLKEAEAEAEELGARFKAAQINAVTDQVLQCLRGTPPAELLHFAVHGTYDPGGLQDGLMLVDGVTLEPFQVQGVQLSRSPFVFLNACQVGMGNRVLGDSSGMAAAFLVAGASGVVAPLWSVKDTIAREIARSFYEKTAKGMSPAEALREARRSFLPGAAPQSATWLAYQYFGHPSLKLRFSIP